MELLREGFSSGWILDAILILVLVEIAVLLLWRSRSTRLRYRPALLSNLLAGFFLILGIRAALGAWPWYAIAGCLIGAGLAHGMDLRARLREASRS